MRSFMLIAVSAIALSGASLGQANAGTSAGAAGLRGWQWMFLVEGIPLSDLLGEIVGLIEIANVLVGEAIDASLHAADHLFECGEVAARGLADELAGRECARVGNPGHQERFGGCLRMHLR